MKFRILITLLPAILLLTGLWGCSLVRTMNTAESMMEERMDVIQTAAVPSPSEAPSRNASPLTKEQAQTIALEHAGFTADQVTRLRTEFEIDDGVPRFEVKFRQGRWEYDYEINADTGELLSYDRDD